MCSAASAPATIWDFAAEVQHQLRPGVSVTGGYYRNWSGNFRVDRQPRGDARRTSARSASRRRVDARLPGGGGYQVCGLYDMSPAKFGRVNNLVTQASNFYGRRAASTATPTAPDRHRRRVRGRRRVLRHVGLLQREHPHAARIGHAARRRRGHRPHGDRQLLCDRLPAAAAELPGGQAVRRPDAAQALRDAIRCPATSR